MQRENEIFLDSKKFMFFPTSVLESISSLSVDGLILRLEKKNKKLEIDELHSCKISRFESHTIINNHSRVSDKSEGKRYETLRTCIIKFHRKWTSLHTH